MNYPLPTELKIISTEYICVPEYSGVVFNNSKKKLFGSAINAQTLSAAVKLAIGIGVTAVLLKTYIEKSRFR